MAAASKGKTNTLADLKKLQNQFANAKQKPNSGQTSKYLNDKLSNPSSNHSSAQTSFFNNGMKPTIKKIKKTSLAREPNTVDQNQKQLKKKT